MLKQPLHVLQVEDDPEDAKLVLRELNAGGFAVTSRRVTNAAELSLALTEPGWDVVLCDYSLPQFCGEAALKMVRQSGCDAPVIFVSGAIGEETAVNAMLLGAHDYVMKDALARLAPAVRRELREAMVRRQARQADANLRESEHKYRHLFESLNECAFLFAAANSMIVDTNAAAERLLGRAREAIVGRRFHEFLHPDLRPDAFTSPTAGATEFEHEITRDNGSRVPVRISLSHVSLHDRPFVLALVHDITAQRQAQAALRASEERFRQVTENIGQVVWLLDAAKAEVIYVSPAYRSVWGRECESLIAEPRSWIDSIHPADRERVRAALPEQRTGDYDIEYRITRTDGSVRWIHDRAFPIRGADGEIQRIAGIAEDITERRQLEGQFHQAQKMEAIGQLAGGIAHDFNNLLTIVTMQCSLLQIQLQEVPEAQAGLQQVLEAANRGVSLTRQLLTFSRCDIEQGAHPIDLANQLGGMAKLLRRIVGEEIEVESRLATGLPSVLADPGKMEQVLMNLVVNARDAMPQGGRLGIDIDAVHVDAVHAARNSSAREGHFVRLSVSDTGSGISPEVLPRIFEPFFTTKEVGKGTGLGLATVFGIVRQHHGWIEVESVLGRGTTFHVLLPALAQPATNLPPAAPSLQAARGHETILLVEDETILRALAVEALQRMGYRTLEARSGAEALQMWDRVNGEVDLMVTDLVMPGGVSGQKLAADLQERRPALKVVYSTGYSSEITDKLTIRSGWNYLAKPYSLQELLSIIRRRLDASAD